MAERCPEVVVIGAGAAGLMAAWRAAEQGRRTLVLEKNRRPGAKILLSGGSHCNLTHDTDNRGIVEAFGPPGRFLHSALANFGVQEALAFFASEGVPTIVAENGKVFPQSDKAADVLAALAARVGRSGASLALNEPVLEVSRHTDFFTLTTSRQVVQTRQVVLTTGGQSYPGCGTTGDGYRFAAQLGHTVIPPRPALVPITVAVPWVAELRGITLPDVTVAIQENTQRLAQRRGSLLLAHFGLSGPVALDLSRIVSRHPHPEKLLCTIDLLPDRRPEELHDFLQRETQAAGKKQLAVVLAALLPRRLCDILLHLAGMPVDRKSAALGKEERGALVRLLKGLPVPITGTLGFQKAEVTTGGVALDEVDSRTMQSKLVPGLWLAGEVLDLDGPIGGYNFQAAWSTGFLAGSTV